jgi:hypothetical protein
MLFALNRSYDVSGLLKYDFEVCQAVALGGVMVKRACHWT